MNTPSTYAIRQLGRRADTIARKAQDLACDINNVFGVESDISNIADDVTCTADTLADALLRLPAIIKAGGRP